MNSRAGKIIRGCVAGLFGIVALLAVLYVLYFVLKTGPECRGCIIPIAFAAGMFIGLCMEGVYYSPLLLVKIGKWLKKIITARRVI